MILLFIIHRYNRVQIFERYYVYYTALQWFFEKFKLLLSAHKPLKHLYDRDSRQQIFLMFVFIVHVVNQKRIKCKVNILLYTYSPIPDSGIKIIAKSRGTQ